MTDPGRGAAFKSARLMNVVDFLQSQRIRMMMMTHLAKATAGVDVYFSAAPAAQRGAPPAAGPAAAAGTPPAGGRGGGGGGGNAGNSPLGNTNSAGYPGLNTVVSFSEPAENAPVGSPQGIVLYGPPFKESEIIFVAKSFQDVAQLHMTKKPVLKV